LGYKEQLKSVVEEGISNDATGHDGRTLAVNQEVAPWRTMFHFFGYVSLQLVPIERLDVPPQSHSQYVKVKVSQSEALKMKVMKCANTYISFSMVFRVDDG
jgi:hypothetical protein